MDFIAVDFEIANNNLNSACSLGIVFVAHNQIIEKKHYFIKPPVLKFNQKMVEIHGITLDQVRNAKNFKEIWEEIHDIFNGENVIVAHNAQFDMSVLYSCLIEYNLPLPDFPFMDSISISAKAMDGNKVGNSLKDRLAFFQIPLENHHDALADAVACAELVISCIKRKNRKSLKAYCNTYKGIPVRHFSELKPATSFRKNKFQRVNIREIVATVEKFDENHPLFGKNVVFTGELQSFDRKTAMQKVVNLGGIIKSGVSKNTDYLVVGKQDHSLVGDKGRRSSKEEKALQLLKNGINIQIIDEERFLKLINHK